MHAFDINSDQAFAYMRRLSQDRNIKLFTIALEILDHREELGRGANRTPKE